MNDFRDVLGSKMSTGMKQKVSIARTIVHDPPVLIFDEPTSGLDVLVARAVLQKILELRDQGKTIVFSTHSMHEVEKLCSRVAIIHKGRLQAEGAPASCCDGLTSPIWKSYSSSWSSAPTRAARDDRLRSASPTASANGDLPPPCSSRFVQAMTRPFHALVEPVRDLPPRGARPDPRPAHAVHDLRAADPAVSDPGYRHHPVRRGARAEAAVVVVVVGAEYLPRAPPLLNAGGDGFNPALFDSPAEASGCVVRTEAGHGPWGDPERQRAGDPRRRGVGGHVIPARSAAAALARARRSRSRSSTTASTSPARSPTSGSRRCSIAWKRAIVAGRLKRDQKTESYAEPIQVKAEDVATAREVGGSVWSRLFPFLLVMMSLTGASTRRSTSVPARRSGGRWRPC